MRAVHVMPARTSPSGIVGSPAACAAEAGARPSRATAAARRSITPDRRASRTRTRRQPRETNPPTNQREAQPPAGARDRGCMRPHGKGVPWRKPPPPAAGWPQAPRDPRPRHRRCSTIRCESQIASPSSTSIGTTRCPLSAATSSRSRAPRDAHLLDLDALLAQLTSNPAAGAQHVRGCAAAIEGRHQPPRSAPATPVACRSPKPVRRRSARLARAGRPHPVTLAAAVPLDRVDERVLVVGGLPAELALGLRRAVGPPERRGAHLTDGDDGRAGHGLGRVGELQRGGDGELDRRRGDAREPAEVGEQPVEREVPVAEDVALADLCRARRRAGARGRRPRRRRCSARRRRRRGSGGAGTGARAPWTSGRRRPCP